MPFVLLPLPRLSCQTMAQSLLIRFSFLCAKSLIYRKANVLPYRLSANCLVERYNRKILNTLRSLIPDTDTLWDTYTPQVMPSLNSTINKSISQTPDNILFA